MKPLEEDLTKYIKGIVHVHGPEGVGKTLLALMSAPPDQIIFIDSDSSKGKTLAHQLGIKDYYDLAQELGEDVSDLEYFEWLNKTTADLINRSDKKRVLVCDNLGQLFFGAKAFTEKHAEQFRTKSNWGGGTMRSYIINSYANKEVLGKRFFSRLTQVAPLVFFISHERDATDDQGNKIPGVKEPDQTKIVNRAAVAQVRLMRDRENPSSQAPVGLTIKRFPMVFKDGEMFNAVPERIAPCTPLKIWEYCHNDPVGKRELNEDERLRDYEYDIIRGAMNVEQRAQYEKMQELRIAEAKAAQAIENQKVERSAREIMDGIEGPPPIVHSKTVERLAALYGHIDRDRLSAIARTVQGG